MKTIKIFSSFFLFFLTLISLNQNVFAQDRYRYGNVIYQIPSGYSQETRDSLVALVPIGQSVDDAEIIFAISSGFEHAPRDLQGTLNTLASQLESGRQVINRETNIRTVDGVKLASLVSVTRSGDTTYVSTYILANPGGRAEFFGVTASNLEAITRYESQINQFFSGIKFANIGPGGTVARNNSSSRSNTRSYSSSNRQQSYSNSNSSRNQQLQRNRANTNQIFLNGIGNNYSNLSRSF